MNPVLIIVAMPFEADRIKKSIEAPVLSDQSVFPYVSGKIAGCHAVVCVGGVGKINAAAATAVMIERIAPELVINTGCAGAYHGSGLSVGDLAIADMEILGDEGVTTSAGWLGLRGMDLPYLTVKHQNYYNEIPLSARVADDTLKFATSCGIPITSGRFVTVSTCSGSLKLGTELAERSNGIAENMEGAAVALTCLRYGIDCLEVRGISNMVDERNMADWDIKLAVGKAQDFILKYLGEFRR